MTAPTGQAACRPPCWAQQSPEAGQGPSAPLGAPGEPAGEGALRKRRPCSPRPDWKERPNVLGQLAEWPRGPGKGLKPAAFSVIRGVPVPSRPPETLYLLTECPLAHHPAQHLPRVDTPHPQCPGARGRGLAGGVAWRGVAWVWEAGLPQASRETHPLEAIQSPSPAMTETWVCILEVCKWGCYFDYGPQCSHL